MKIIRSPYFDPYSNLALEEILLQDDSQKEDILCVYQNTNAIIIGRNQNAYEEIDVNFVKEHRINLARRISGGGAVYHDLGNVNFSFITTKKDHSFAKFLEPIVAFLNSLGCEAKLEGKNDLKVKGLKISGSAQYIYKERMFHHGTLLFNTNLSILKQALKPNPLKINSKAIASIPSGVINILECLPNKMDVESFALKLIDFFIQNYQGKIWDVSSYKNDDLEKLRLIRCSNDWIYVKTPNFTWTNMLRFPGGTIKVRLNIFEQKIQTIAFEGDFLSSNDVEKISNILENQPYTFEHLQDFLPKIPNFDHFFGKITPSELLLLIWIPSNIYK